MWTAIKRVFGLQTQCCPDASNQSECDEKDFVVQNEYDLRIDLTRFLAAGVSDPQKYPAKLPDFIAIRPKIQFRLVAPI
jgi:hypothetical protein